MLFIICDSIFRSLTEYNTLMLNAKLQIIFEVAIVEAMYLAICIILAFYHFILNFELESSLKKIRVARCVGAARKINVSLAMFECITCDV